MELDEAKHKLDYMKKAYQKLIDEKVDSGQLVGDGVRGEWKAETPLDEAYKSMIDALEIAIKALEQEPCDDAVSRQAVLDINEHHHGQMPNHVNHEIWKEIKALPPVAPQPKMGRWIMSDDGLYRPICNNCGAHPWKGYIPTVEEATEVFKYCPNCGCAMQEVEE